MKMVGRIIIPIILTIAMMGCAVSETINTTMEPTNKETQNDGVVEVVKEDQALDESKIAVVYFSVTGNTETVAGYIKDEVGADVFEIVPKQEYTDADLQYNDRNTRATREQDDKNARPEIKSDINILEYDTVFLGYPIWWGDCPKIIQTFIETGKLNGKSVIPFCTSGSSGISGSEVTLKAYKDVNWLAGKRLTTSKDEVVNWVKSLNINTAKEAKENGDLNTIKVEVNNKELIVELEDNQATKELIKKLNEGNVIVEAQEYGGFEKVGSLGFSLTRDDKQIKTEAGDIVLYQGNQISLFYNSNSWSYTKLGKVTNVSASELKDLLGTGDVTITLKK